MSACSDLRNAICVPCTCPSTGFSYLTSAGRPYQTDQCDWECDSGYWMNETLQGCKKCEHLLCPTGQYRLLCGGGVCASCTNARVNSSYMESVLPTDAPLGLYESLQVAEQFLIKLSFCQALSSNSFYQTLCLRPSWSDSSIVRWK